MCLKFSCTPGLCCELLVTSFVDILYFFYPVFAVPLCLSVYMCLVVTCWERADLLALVCCV